MASAATFAAYIDEAGDEGFKFGKGSSEWFVLGAAILRRATEMPEIKLIDDVRNRLNRGRKPDRHFPLRKHCTSATSIIMYANTTRLVSHKPT